MTGRTLVLTGGGGLVGSHLIRELDQSWSVQALNRGGHVPDVPNARTITMDLTQPIDCQKLPVATNAVVHLAQSSRFRDFPDGAEDMLAVNVARTIDLAHYAVATGAKTFVYASTGGIYGTGPTPFRETDDPASALDFYPASKLAAEQLLRPFAKLIDIVILRFFFVYGAGQKRGMLVPRLIDSVRERRRITLQGDNGITINPVHAKDAAAAIVRALTFGDSVTLNVGGPERLTLRQIGETIGSATGIAPDFTTEPNIMPGNLIGDIERQTAFLGAPRIRLADGLRSLL